MCGTGLCGTLLDTTVAGTTETHGRGGWGRTKTRRKRTRVQSVIVYSRHIRILVDCCFGTSKRALQAGMQGVCSSSGFLVRHGGAFFEMGLLESGNLNGLDLTWLDFTNLATWPHACTHCSAMSRVWPHPTPALTTMKSFVCPSGILWSACHRVSSRQCRCLRHSREGVCSCMCLALASCCQCTCAGLVSCILCQFYQIVTLFLTLHVVLLDLRRRASHAVSCPSHTHGVNMCASH